MRRARPTPSSANALAHVSADRLAMTGRIALARVAQAFLKWLEVHGKPQTTVRSYADALGVFLTYTDGVGLQYPDEVSILACDGFYAWLGAGGTSLRTAAHRRAVLKSWWSWMEHEGFAHDNPPGKTFAIKFARPVPVYLEGTKSTRSSLA